MSYTTVKDEIYAILSGVAGVNNAYDYPRLKVALSGDESSQKAAFVFDSIMQTWWMERVSAPSEKLPQSDVFRNHTWRITGFYQVNDEAETEHTIQQLADTICNTFNNVSNIHLNGTAELIPAATLEEKEDVIFCSTLCHKVVLNVQANEDVMQ